ncbi:MAG: outer membrane beta-barrel protein [Candidatus Aminicenantaceae bacterium]
MKNTALVVLLLAAATAGFGQERPDRVQITAFGGIHHHYEYGTLEDYAAGINNFPVLPAHSPANFGAAFAYFFTPWLGLEYDMRLSQRTEVMLTDPSDKDNLTIQTPKHASMTLSLLLQPVSGRISPYVLVGGGVDRIIVEDENYISKFGYEISMPAPPEDEKVDVLAQVGVGISLKVFKSFGIRGDVRYMFVFDDPYKVKSLTYSVGLFARF